MKVRGEFIVRGLMRDCVVAIRIPEGVTDADPRFRECLASVVSLASGSHRIELCCLDPSKCRRDLDSPLSADSRAPKTAAVDFARKPPTPRPRGGVRREELRARSPAGRSLAP